MSDALTFATDTSWIDGLSVAHFLSLAGYFLIGMKSEACQIDRESLLVRAGLVFILGTSS